MFENWENMQPYKKDIDINKDSIFTCIEKINKIDNIDKLKQLLLYTRHCISSILLNYDKENYYHKEIAKNLGHLRKLTYIYSLLALRKNNLEKIGRI